MLQEVITAVSDNPEVATGIAGAAIFLSEALGFTKKGGIVKVTLSLLIFLGRIAMEAKAKMDRKKAAANPEEESGV